MSSGACVTVAHCGVFIAREYQVWNTGQSIGLRLLEWILVQFSFLEGSRD
jgi:hypothetical protein